MASAPTGRPKWLPAALVAAVAAVAVGVVAVILLAFGDDPATTTAKDAQPAATELKDVTLAGQDLYTPRPGAGYVALMPAGWPVTKTRLALPLQDAVVVKSAQDSSSTVTVGVLGADTGTLKASAKSLTDELGSAAKVQSSNPTGFSGRKAWRVLYTAGGVSQVAYLFNGCDRRYAVVGAAKPETFDTVSARYGIVASSMQLTC